VGGGCDVQRPRIQEEFTWNSYSTAEVEHSLATTQEMNVNLQILLEKALNSQKQSNASTNHVVRNIQSDISKVSCYIQSRLVPQGLSIRTKSL
jgi:hypothetical protein